MKKTLKEWAKPSKDKFYPGKYVFYTQTGKLAGDMTYEINDIGELAANSPIIILDGIKEYFECDYVNWRDERDPKAPAVLYVQNDNGMPVDNTYYISSLDRKYASQIQSALGADAKIVTVNPQENGR